MDMETEDKRQRVAAQFKQLGDQHFEEGALSDAYFHYINCMKTSPTFKHELKEKFLHTLSTLGQQLENRGHIDELFRTYLEAISYYSDCEEIYHNIGAHYLRLGYPNEAAREFERALNLNPDYFPAYRSLQSTYCALVERWHFRMLNDTVRNEKYQKAIQRKIREGFDSVLDIGTGTGLFCLYALREGAKKVYGCDYNPTMIKIASRVLSGEFSATDRWKMTDKHSIELTIPDDIPERVSLVVTETMDSCMLGEHMLGSLHHAWQNLLHPSGRVIPSRGTLFFTFVDSRMLARKYMFPLDHPVNADDCANAFANISLQDNVASKFQPLSFHNLSLFVELNEPYDTERLRDMADCRFLFDPIELFSIDFNNFEQINELMQGRKQRSFEIENDTNSNFHAVVAWFRVDLDEDLKLSSSPFDWDSKQCCWDQVVFPCRRVHQVVPGCRISLLCDWTDSRVTLQAQKITYPDGSTRFLQTETEMRAPSSIIVMLNDTSLLKHLHAAALKFLEDFRGQDELRIFDAFAVPVFGLTVLRNLGLLNRSLREIRLFCIIESEDASTVILKMAESNGIPLACIEFLHKDDFDDVQIRQLTRSYFDAIILDLFDQEGDFNESMIGRIRLLKPALKEDGVMLPHSVEVCSQIINCDYILRNMRMVSNDATTQLGAIVQQINQYQVSQMVEINLPLKDYRELSQPLLIHLFQIDNLDSELEKEFFGIAKHSGDMNSLVYWFQVHFYDDHPSYSTFNESSYVHQAAFLLENEERLVRNVMICLKFVYHHGTFNITVNVDALRRCLY